MRQRLLLIFATLMGVTLAGISFDNMATFEIDFDESRPDFSDADSVHKYFQQAVFMLHAKRYELAVQSLHQVFKLQPQMPEAHVNMGYALLGLGEYTAARDFFESATDLRASQYNGYYGLAIASEEMGDLAAATAAMKTYLHVAPPDDPFRRKAESAVWEWATELERKKEK